MSNISHCFGSVCLPSHSFQMVRHYKYKDKVDLRQLEGHRVNKQTPPNYYCVFLSSVVHARGRVCASAAAS